MKGLPVLCGWGGRLLQAPAASCSQAFLTWIGGELPILACFWELSGPDKGMAGFAHSFERRGLSETQSACGRPLETLSPRWSQREHLCVCLLWFGELNTPF